MDDLLYQVPISDRAPDPQASIPGALWFSQKAGQLYVLYEDQNGDRAWVQASTTEYETT